MDINWLAGLLEQGGSFYLRKGKKGTPKIYPTIICSMADKEVLKKVAKVFDKRLRGPYFNKTTGHRIYQTSIQGKRAGEWMCELLPLMGKRRKEQITQVLNGALK